MAMDLTKPLSSHGSLESGYTQPATSDHRPLMGWASRVIANALAERIQRNLKGRHGESRKDGIP